MAGLGPVTYLIGRGVATEARCDLSEHNSSLRSDREVVGGGEERKNGGV